jgi:hypothetical protein
MCELEDDRRLDGRVVKASTQRKQGGEDANAAKRGSTVGRDAQTRVHSSQGQKKTEIRYSSYCTV